MKQLTSIIILISICITPLTAGSLHDAAWSGDFQKVQDILSEDNAQLNTLNEYGSSPLSNAIQQNHDKIAQYLIEQGADVHWQAENKRSLLFYVDDPEMAQLLIDKGIDINARDQWQNVAMHMQALYGRTEVVKALIQNKANPNSLNESSESPIFWALEQEHNQTAEIMAENGANIHLQNSGQISLLHIAADMGNAQAVEWLLARQIDVSAKEKRFQRTGLHIAALKGSLPIVKALIKSGISLDNADNLGNTPLTYAAAFNHTQVAHFLSAAGAKDPGFWSIPAQKLFKKPLENDKAVVWYLTHSGWAVKTPKRLLVFDYWKDGNLPTNASLNNGFLNTEEFKDMPVTLFVSHEHTDHFDADAIKDLVAKKKDIHLVFGFEPKDSFLNHFDKNHYTIMTAHQSEMIDNMMIKTLKSTDAGVGFLVQADGLTLFHAGDHADLNDEIASVYKKELDQIGEGIESIDIAFLPVSGCPVRWKPENVKDGFFYAIDNLHPSVVFPMHGGSREETYLPFHKASIERNCPAQVICVTYRGERFSYTDGKATSLMPEALKLKTSVASSK